MIEPLNVTREKFPKKELVRIVRTPENKVEIDLTGKLNGRGAYLKKDKDVVEYSMSKNVSSTLIAEYRLKLIDQKVLEKKLREVKNLLKKKE